MLAGCLRNARAVGELAQRLGEKIAVIPAGEQWPDGRLRPAIEDWIGAGAILSHLTHRTAEAETAVEAFASTRETLLEHIRGCVSGRELIDRGFESDVLLAAELDVSQCAPTLVGGAYVGS